ncbi:MAG: hypothetical protein AAB089_02645, partial [Nitrospirota bacterium]
MPSDQNFTCSFLCILSEALFSMPVFLYHRLNKKYNAEYYYISVINNYNLGIGAVLCNYIIQ